MELVIQLRTAQHLHIKEDARFTLTKTCSIIGGLLGIWFGASFLDIFYVFLFLIKCVWRRLRATRRRYQVHAVERKLGVLS